MQARLSDLEGGTIFDCHGKTYKKGGICGPVIYKEGKFQPWVHGDEVDQREQGVACQPKLGGLFQGNPALRAWFPNSATVTVT